MKAADCGPCSVALPRYVCLFVSAKFPPLPLPHCNTHFSPPLLLHLPQGKGGLFCMCVLFLSSPFEVIFANDGGGGKCESKRAAANHPPIRLMKTAPRDSRKNRLSFALFTPPPQMEIKLSLFPILFMTEPPSPQVLIAIKGSLSLSLPRFSLHKPDLLLAFASAQKGHGGKAILLGAPFPSESGMRQ